MDPLTALTALLPLGIEAGKAIINRWIAPDQIKPTSVDDLVKLRQLDLDHFKVMQGGDGQSYPWVEAIRQLQRPVFSAAVLAVWTYQAVGGEPTESIANMAAAVGFYLFGDRTLFYVKSRK